ncbi:response regulator [Variovorax sp. RHLX14]|uniref:response regulator n=1 Tax=Variovorax sp. RHLX14 TaxID=1259731 RepID=UPI003F448BB4
MFKSAHRISAAASVVQANVLLAFAAGCITFHVALTAVWAGLLGDVPSMVVGFGVTVLVTYRLLLMASATDRVRDDLGIVAAMLAWSACAAYRSSETVCWLPAMLVVVFLAPQWLMFGLLAASVVLAGTAGWLEGAATAGVQAGGIALATGLCAALYRLAQARHEVQQLMEVQRLKAIVEAAGVGFMELDDRGSVLLLSRRLLIKLGAQDAQTAMSAWRMLDLFHPDDHLAAARALQRAAAGEPGTLVPRASCECRLLRSDGSALWVDAQFLKPMPPARGAVAAFLDIADRKRLESELGESRRRLDAQNQELATQFEVSKNALHARQEVERLAQHDLKSPLKSIAATVSLLRDGRTLSASEEVLLGSIERTAGRALAIVSMSLDLYRMEEGTFRFVPEVVDLGEIGRRVIAEISLHARTKNVRLDFVGMRQAVRAVGNDVFVTSIVENLVRNAVEAAPEHSAVRLVLYDGVRVGLIIHNEGAVPEEIRGNFFEKYVTHGKRDGLGFGTYSARLIARAQGGELSMSSSDQNGTTLTLELNRNAGLTEKPMQFLPAAPPQNLSPLDLLVVEDDDHNWLLLSSWMPAHVSARRAINGRDAVDALVERRPDLVVMDLEMPVMNGFEALYRIREMQSLAGEEASMVCAFTGYDDVDTRQRIRCAGFDGILSKPVVKAEFDALLASIAREETPVHERKVWVEKKFAEAFPEFIESRRALVDDIERAAAAGDPVSARRAAHTLAGSPAIHDFDAGVLICRNIIASPHDVDAAWLAAQIATLRKLLADPEIR